MHYSCDIFETTAPFRFYSHKIRAPPPSMARTGPPLRWFLRHAPTRRPMSLLREPLFASRPSSFITRSVSAVVVTQRAQDNSGNLPAKGMVRGRDVPGRDRLEVNLRVKQPQGRLDGR